jgi:hypothetical protein
MMFLEPIATGLRDFLGEETVIKRKGRDSYSVFVPGFYFADGDAPKIVLKHGAGGSCLLSDEGDTLMRLSCDDSDIYDDPVWRALLKKTLSSHFMEERDGRLIMPDITSENIASGVFTFVRGLLEIGNYRS